MARGKNKPMWDRTAKAYAAFMYVSEALTVIFFALFVVTGRLVPAVAAIIMAIVAGNFHLLLQNYGLHRLEGGCSHERGGED